MAAPVARAAAVRTYTRAVPTRTASSSRRAAAAAAEERRGRTPSQSTPGRRAHIEAACATGWAAPPATCPTTQPSSPRAAREPARWSISSHTPPRPARTRRTAESAPPPAASVGVRPTTSTWSPSRTSPLTPRSSAMPRAVRSVRPNTPRSRSRARRDTASLRAHREARACCVRPGDPQTPRLHLGDGTDRGGARLARPGAPDLVLALAALSGPTEPHGVRGSP